MPLTITGSTTVIEPTGEATPRRPLARTTAPVLVEPNAELDEIALDWELRAWGADWNANRYGALLRSLALLAEVAHNERRGVYVRFDV